jgi:hypothetical protein
MESDVLPTPQSDLYAILKLCCTYTSDTASLRTLALGYTSNAHRYLPVQFAVMLDTRKRDTL